MGHSANLRRVRIRKQSRAFWRVRRLATSAQDAILGATLPHNGSSELSGYGWLKARRGQYWPPHSQNRQKLRRSCFR